MFSSNSINTNIKMYKPHVFRSVCLLHCELSWTYKLMWQQCNAKSCTTQFSLVIWRDCSAFHFDRFEIPLMFNFFLLHYWKVRNHLYVFLDMNCLLSNILIPIVCIYRNIEIVLFNSWSLRLLFCECSPDNIVQFLKSANLFSKMW